MLFATRPASAHQDPPTCFETGPAIVVSVFRANGTTGVVGSVSECETLQYRARLQKAQDIDSICAFAEGTFSLTTPDGVVHLIDGDVPCIGGTDSAEGCTAALDFIESNLIPYTVDPADISGGLITATAQYTGGVAHDSEANTAGVGANTPRSIPVVVCDDNNLCTTDICDPNASGAGACSFPPVVCDDNSLCTTEFCNPATGQCVFNNVDCDDNDLCTVDSCDPATGCVNAPITCNDNDACTSDTCDPATGCVFTPGALNCDDNDVCTTDTCDPQTGCVNTPGAQNCDDNDICTDDRCDPVQGCVHVFDPGNAPECAPTGCRLTGGGITPDGGVDLNEFADTIDAHHGGQVGAPCGCIGCFDEFDHVQGQWQHQRRKQKSNFHASDFNSLVCGCDGVLDGNLCNPGDRDLGPEPRPAPANLACFTGKGTLKRNGKTTEAAFRVEVEDRGEPGAGENSAPTPDVYRMRIWVPRGQETIEGLAAGACCTNGAPVGQAARQPDIDDGGDILKGNLQIHPQIPAHIGECPVPNGVCTAEN